jgi:hypothetical protein
MPIRPLQLYADGGYQLRIRRLEGISNYGPRQYPYQQGASSFSEAYLERTSKLISILDLEKFGMGD